MRRALANVPVYMMCDDHEITDDWYISWSWVADVMQHPLGRRAISNGLAAFAVCQAWGNSPERFTTGQPGERLLDALVLLNQARGRSAEAREEITHTVGLPYGDVEVRTFLDDLAEQERLGRVGERPWHNSLHWHYRLDGPGHEVIVLDTRTWRGFAALKDRRGRALPVHQQIGWPALAGPQHQPPDPNRLHTGLGLPGGLRPCRRGPGADADPTVEPERSGPWALQLDPLTFAGDGRAVMPSRAYAPPAGAASYLVPAKLSVTLARGESQSAHEAKLDLALRLGRGATPAALTATVRLDLLAGGKATWVEGRLFEDLPIVVPEEGVQIGRTCKQDP